MPFFVHMFLADWSYCQVPVLGNLGRMQALVGSYQYLQKAHFFHIGLFILMFTVVHIGFPSSFENQSSGEWGERKWLSALS